MSDSTGTGWLFLTFLLAAIIWLFVIVLCLYGYFLLFKIGYWWVIPILFITHTIAVTFTRGLTKNLVTYFSLTILLEIVFISAPFVLYAFLKKGQGNANNGRRNVYQRPATLPPQRPRTV